MDRLTKAERSANMARIRGKDTGPERAVRSLLHRLGFRFRLHGVGLPGRPDVVLAKYTTVLFVHGCFWHRHSRCRFAYIPKTRRAFWAEKFRDNQMRDRRVAAALRDLGWRVFVVWECELRDVKALSRRITATLHDRQRTRR